MMQQFAAMLCTTALGSVICVTAARAQSGSCDLITLSGTGTVSRPGLTITGSETLNILESGNEVLVNFTAEPLGTVEVDATNGVSTSIYSHDFQSIRNKSLTFTTLDEIKIVPLGADPTCAENPCGLVFRLKLIEGQGKYNCGEIVSGFDPSPDASIPFTSYSLPDGTVTFNSRGKLCKCSGNN